MCASVHEVCAEESSTCVSYSNWLPWGDWTASPCISSDIRECQSRTYYRFDGTY